MSGGVELVCTACQVPLDEVRGRRDDRAALRCPVCGATWGVLGGIAWFGEPQPHGVALDDWLDGLAAAHLPVPGELDALVARQPRPTDAYAAFQPFNESGRTIEAFAELLDGDLRPGDVIVDLWNRTGWTGAWLAARFPAQRVVSFWEGPHDTLGWKGFATWCGAERRLANLTIALAHPGGAWPLAAGSAAAVHGYDTLHRYDLDHLTRELARVARPGAPLIFPHVHLANAEPTPWFEREGTLRQGGALAARLETLAGAARRVFVLGERRLFTAMVAATSPAPAPAPRLAHDPDTTDYNGVVVVAPVAWAGRELARATLPAALAAATVIGNPLVDVDALSGRATIAAGALAEHLLVRHPVYAERLAAALPTTLDELGRRIVYLADRAADVSGLARLLGVEPDALREPLQRLAEREIVRVAAVGTGGARLQRFLGRRELMPFADEDTLPALWRRAVARFATRPFLVDDAGDAVLTYGDADELVARLAARLAGAGVAPGATIAVVAALHLEAVLVFWAAAHLGVTVAFPDPSAPEAVTMATLDRVSPVLVFADAAAVAAVAAGGHAVVRFDELDDPAARAAERAPGPGPAFADWLDETATEVDPPTIAAPGATTPAVVLFTSGSTGGAKGVVLTQGALCHSGRLAARQLGFRATDVHLGLGGLHAMSGLRNPCVAVVHAGAATVIADDATRAQPLALAALVARRGVTLLTAVPAALRLLVLAADRLPSPRGLAPLRAVLCTGTRLPPELRTAFAAAFAVPVQDYYGLTETSGLCVAAPAEGDDGGAGLGHPVDALLRVVDDAGHDVEPGAPGELLIFSANLMRGYLDDPAATAAAFQGAWFCTGDLVRSDPAGRLHLVGRRKLIAKNDHGDVVALADIEDALCAHPGVADAVACVGLAGADGRERVVAVVVPRQALGGAATNAWLDELREHLLHRLGARRQPAQLVARDHIPRGAAGKPARATLLQEIARDAAR